MISPALITYSFYRDAAEKNARALCLLRRIFELGVQGKNILDLSVGIRAFNLVFSGDCAELPICRMDQIIVSKILLGERLIDAYRAGISSGVRGYKWHYEGGALPVALSICKSRAVRIPGEALDQALIFISEANAGARVIEQVAGTETELSGVIPEKCYEAGFNYSFLEKLK